MTKEMMGCESSIEKMFFLAFNSAHVGIGQYHLIPQYEIESSGHKYRADFALADESDDVLFLIECDGHDYHGKTKAQIKSRNERDYNLMCCGWNVLHFSGTQIYNDPYKCAMDTIAYADIIQSSR